MKPSRRNDFRQIFHVSRLCIHNIYQQQQQVNGQNMPNTTVINRFFQTPQQFLV